MFGLGKEIGMASRTISKMERFEVLKRGGFRCHYCGRGAAEVTLDVDHVIPVCLGGTNAPDNLVAACTACNLGKTDILLTETAEESRRRPESARRRGRPALGERRLVMMSVRVDEVELAEWRADAKRRGEPLSRWMRRFLDAAARKGLRGGLVVDGVGVLQQPVESDAALTAWVGECPLEVTSLACSAWSGTNSRSFPAKATLVWPLPGVKR